MHSICQMLGWVQHRVPVTQLTDLLNIKTQIVRWERQVETGADGQLQPVLQ